MVYFAGMLFDFLIVGVLYWFTIVTKIYHMNFAVLNSFFIAVILCELAGIVWQFDVFIETDMYNFLTEYLNIEFIRNDAIRYFEQHTEKWKKLLFLPIKKMLKYYVKGIADNTDDLRLLNYSERKKIKIFIGLLIVGLITSTSIFIFYSLPRDIIFVYQSFQDIILEYHRRDFISLGKYLVVITLTVFDYSFLVIIWIIRRRKIHRIKR